jgi:hydroxyacylglutathione hydrolase
VVAEDVRNRTVERARSHPGFTDPAASGAILQTGGASYNLRFHEHHCAAGLFDNYIWLLHDGRRALVVDPGGAKPVLKTLLSTGLDLEAILVTHHHADHTGGVSELREATGATVWGPAREAIPEPFIPLHDGDTVTALGVAWSVLDVPGHTAGHIAFWASDIDGAPLLFCGDTLFSGGCGRLFEGTPAQMLASLDRLAALAGNTRVCCTHEYTLSNLRFARTVEPGNAALQQYEQDCMALRQRDLPTLPSTLATELLINPFLRSREASVKGAVQAWRSTADDAAAVFASLRQWKNEFR